MTTLKKMFLYLAVLLTHMLVACEPPKLPPPDNKGVGIIQFDPNYPRRVNIAGEPYILQFAEDANQCRAQMGQYLDTQLDQMCECPVPAIIESTQEEALILAGLWSSKTTLDAGFGFRQLGVTGNAAEESAMLVLFRVTGSGLAPSSPGNCHVAGPEQRPCRQGQDWVRYDKYKKGTACILGMSRASGSLGAGTWKVGALAESATNREFARCPERLQQEVQDVIDKEGIDGLRSKVRVMAKHYRPTGPVDECLFFHLASIPNPDHGSLERPRADRCVSPRVTGSESIDDSRAWQKDGT